MVQKNLKVGLLCIFRTNVDSQWNLVYWAFLCVAVCCNVLQSHMGCWLCGVIQELNLQGVAVFCSLLQRHMVVRRVEFVGRESLNLSGHDCHMTQIAWCIVLQVVAVCCGVLQGVRWVELLGHDTFFLSRSQLPNDIYAYAIWWYTLYRSQKRF